MAEKGTAFYAATVGNLIAGIFSSPEKAPDGADISEITPIYIEGSPRSEKYICMAEGTWSVVHYKDGQFSGEDFETGPIWGYNPQSAIAGLFGYNFSRQSVHLTALFLYEIDRICTGGDIINLSRTAPFSGIAQSISANGRITPETAATDYIGLYLAEKRKQEELARKRGAVKVSVIGSKLITLKCSFILEKEKVIFCGTSLASQRRLLEEQLLIHFSENELIRLAEILQSVVSTSVPETLLRFRNLSDEERKPVERALDYVPPVGGRRFTIEHYK